MGDRLGDRWGITGGSLGDHWGIAGGSLVTLRVGDLRAGKLTWPLGHWGITGGSLGDRWGIVGNFEGGKAFGNSSAGCKNPIKLKLGWGK